MPLKQSWTNEDTGDQYAALHVQPRSLAFYFDDSGQAVRAWIVVDLYRDAAAFAEGRRPVRADVGYGVDADAIKAVIGGPAWAAKDVAGVTEALLTGGSSDFATATAVPTVEKIDLAPVPEPVTLAVAP